MMLDAIYNSTTKVTTLSGTSEANSSVSVYDSGQLIGTVNAAADGTWSLSANVTGSTIHSYTESATDLAGNVGSSAGVTLYTPAASISLKGGSGNDVLIGKPNDTLTGGAGSDTFVFNPGFGKETITDFVDFTAAQSTHAAPDIIDLHQLAFSNFAQVQADAAQVGKNVVITVDAQDTITLVGVKLGDLTAHDFQFV
jgi:Ca2+-binding RTX toxin-like protein